MRRYLRGSWNRKLPTTSPDDGASLTHVNRMYKIAALAVKCLQDRFGREKLLAFFELVVEFGNTFARASTTAFQVDWAEVESGCVARIRAA